MNTDKHLNHLLMGKLLFLSTILFVMTSVSAQGLPDSVSTEGVSLDSVVKRTNYANAPLKTLGFEIYKVKGHRKFLILKGKTVRIICSNKKGRARVKRARLTEVHGNLMTFMPFNKKYDEVTYSDESLDYIAFTTPGSVTRGIVVNTLVLTFVAIEILMVPIALVTGDASLVPGISSFRNLPWDDCHKHIYFFQNGGHKKWGIITETRNMFRN